MLANDTVTLDGLEEIIDCEGRCPVVLLQSNVRCVLPRWATAAAGDYYKPA
jgi:hypothetical protein